jgi:hypothetical protein
MTLTHNNWPVARKTCMLLDIAFDLTGERSCR